MNNHLMKLLQTSLPTVKETVDQLEVALLKEEQVECAVYHHFFPGIYIREVNIPRGALAVGHRQRFEHLNVFLKGDVSILNDDGSLSRIKAPMMFMGKPGRKCGYVHENVVWLNVYATDETDVETLESTYLDKSTEFLNREVAELSGALDQEDFLRMLTEYGVSAETVRSQSENRSDMRGFPAGSYAVAVFKSPIEGRGLFATAPFSPGDVIAPARLEGLRTPAGRFTNHSMSPNARMEKLPNGDIQLVALKHIQGMRGGQIGDEITTDYRQTLDIMGVKKCQE